MRKYEQLENIKESDFKRIVGVKRSTFKVMVAEYKESEEKRKKEHKIGGRKPKLSEWNRVLLMLEYYREYRTLVNVGLSYGISEGHASKTVRNVEDVLIKSGKFSLPSKRALHDESEGIKFILIDATESPIERPKKSKKNTIQGRRSNIR